MRCLIIFTVVLFLLGVTSAASYKESEKEVEQETTPKITQRPPREKPQKENKFKIFGREFVVPGFVNWAVEKWTAAVHFTKDFLTGGKKFKEVSSQVRSQLPVLRGNITQSVKSFVSGLKTDSGSRVILAVLVNMAFLVLLYIFIFFKLVCLSLKESRRASRKRHSFVTHIPADQLNMRNTKQTAREIIRDEIRSRNMPTELSELVEGAHQRNARGSRIGCNSSVNGSLTVHEFGSSEMGSCSPVPFPKGNLDNEMDYPTPNK